jgi:hypothetical protein
MWEQKRRLQHRRPDLRAEEEAVAICGLSGRLRFILFSFDDVDPVA